MPVGEPARLIVLDCPMYFAATFAALITGKTPVCASVFLTDVDICLFLHGCVCWNYFALADAFSLAAHEKKHRPIIKRFFWSGVLTHTHTMDSSWVYPTEMDETYLTLRTRTVKKKGYWYQCGTCYKAFEVPKPPHQVPDPQNGPYGMMPVCAKCFSNNEYRELWHDE